LFFIKVLGIIAEYNPMHNGHIYHINKAKELTNADYTVLIISGDFTQTGNIAILDKFERSKIANKYGVDLVIELPTIYATSSSEYFCFNAVNILNNLGIVDYICFGTECTDISILNSIASKLLLNENSIWNDIKNLDVNNLTFAKNRNIILEKYLDKDELIEISKPNNILGIEYIKSLIKLKSKITPIAIKREYSEYNEDLLNINPLFYTSATSIRKSLKDNNFEYIKNYVPKYIYDKLNNSNLLFNNDLFLILRYKINDMDIKDLENINEVTEGLENRIKKAIVISNSYEDLIKNIKSKRYIENKIKRILINILLGITKDLFNYSFKNNITYARVLSIKEESKILLSLIDKRIPVITKINEKVLNSLDNNIKNLLDIDIKAGNIYNILNNKIINTDFTNKI
jgi:predicted nucleotidyltransferase